MRGNRESDIQLSQLFDVGDEHDCEIHFDRGDCLNSVRNDIRALAVNRCHRMLRSREERVNMLDHDYQSPSPTSSE